MRYIYSTELDLDGDSGMRMSPTATGGRDDCSVSVVARELVMVCLVVRSCAGVKTHFTLSDTHSHSRYFEPRYVGLALNVLVSFNAGSPFVLFLFQYPNTYQIVTSGH